MFLFFLHEQETSCSLLQKCDKYQPKCDKYQPKCDKHQPKCDKYQQKCDKYQPKCDKYQPKDNHNSNKSGNASNFSNRRSVPLQIPLAVLYISLSDNAMGVKLQGITVPLSVKTISNSIPVNTNTDTASPVSLVSTELQLLLKLQSTIWSTGTVLNAANGERSRTHGTKSITLANYNRQWKVLVVVVENLATPLLLVLNFLTNTIMDFESNKLYSGTEV